MIKTEIYMTSLDGKVNCGPHAEKVVFVSYDPINGRKFLNGSRTDNKVARKEAERLYTVRSGRKPESLDFIWK